MRKEISTPEEAIEHARLYGRDFATDRVAKHRPEFAPKDYWKWPMNKSASNDLAECRHSEVEIEESSGGDEYRESPGEFTPDLKFAVCKDCGEIV